MISPDTDKLQKTIEMAAGHLAAAEKHDGWKHGEIETVRTELEIIQFVCEKLKGVHQHKESSFTQFQMYMCMMWTTDTNKADDFLTSGLMTVGLADILSKHIMSNYKKEEPNDGTETTSGT